MSYVYHSMPNEPGIEEVPPTTDTSPHTPENPPTPNSQPPKTSLRDIYAQNRTLILILALAVLTIIIYVFYTENNRAIPFVGVSSSVDMDKIWRENQCTYSINDSLVYSVHIETVGTSVTSFSCKDGPAAPLINQTYFPVPLGSKLCNRETVELIDSVVKGRNTTSVRWLRPFDIPGQYATDDLNNYTVNMIFCKNSTGAHFFVQWFIEYKGQEY